MTDDSGRTDGLADVINLLAAPIASGIRTAEQFRRGIDELLRSVENLNRTMENLNETATRVNRLIGDIEEPVRAMIPQLTRTVENADRISRMLEGPIEATAPNIERMVETLSSPGFASLPDQLGGFMHALGEMSKGLGPLTQFAENAGGLFGGFKLPGVGGRPTPSSALQSRSTDPATVGTTTKKPAAKKPAAKKSAARKPATKKPAAKKSAAKKSAAKKSASKKPAK
jgi:hypothetical protein